MNLSRLPSNGPVLSVVIPVFNEKPVLPRLYERLHKALDSLDFQYEIVFVDSGGAFGPASLKDVGPCGETWRAMLGRWPSKVRTNGASAACAAASRSTS